MAKAKTKTPELKELPFSEREIKLTEMVNEAIKATGVGLKPVLQKTDAAITAVIASVDLLVQTDGKEVKQGIQSAPVRS